ncbi:MAG: Na+/H+ antiporter subunit E [Pseudomonadota bacterium]
MLRRLLPHPTLTLLIALVWILMSNVVTINAVVFGLILGLVIPVLTAAYWPNRPKLHNPLMIAEYALVVLYDIVVANVIVARTILLKRNDQMHPAWIAIPLDLHTPEAITALAGTITMTPGTLSADLSDGGRCLLVHCLDAPDPDAVRDEIKSRYERRLKEIFE